MKMEHSVLKVLAVSIAGLYVGCYSKVSNAMDYQSILEETKDDKSCLLESQRNCKKLYKGNQ